MTQLCKDLAGMHPYEFHIKIEYHAHGGTWYQPLLSYGK